jgi:hypothetical protein
MTQPTLNGTPASNPFAQAAGGIRTVSDTTPSLTNGCKIIGVPWIDLDAQTITSVTYGGVACASVGSTYVEVETNESNYNVGVELFRLVNPSAGTADIVVTSPSGAGFGGGLNHAVFVANFENVHQTTPIGIDNEATSPTPISNPQVTINPSTSNDVAIGLCCSIRGVDDMDVAGGGIILGTRLSNGAFADVSSVFQYSTATNPTLQWSLTAPSLGGNAQSGFSLKGTGGGGGGSDIFISFTG